jgi:hypothetical protein
MPITVLVTGVGGSAAFNFIDSLKLVKPAYRVVGTDTNLHHLALSNADYKYRVPPISKSKSYLSVINRLIEKHHVDLVHPQPDPEVAFIGKYRQHLNAPTLLPNNQTITYCQDKLKAVDLFKQSGVPIADSVLIYSPASLKKTYTRLKKQHETLWIRAIRGAGSKAALPINEINHAIFWIDYWTKHQGIGYGDFMLSEYLPGKEFAFQSVWKAGQLLVSQARERQEYVFGNLTPSGQSSSPSVAVTVRRKDVNQIATQAVLAIDPQATGIFCVDLKENKQGTPCVIEINPGRFFTTSNFFAHAGCNMPDYYVRLALNKPLPPLKPYNNLKAGLYWLRLIDMGYKLTDTDWGIDGDFS